MISKLEKPSAVEQLDDIVDSTDAVMVARGDIGVELPLMESGVINVMRLLRVE